MLPGTEYLRCGTRAQRCICSLVVHEVNCKCLILRLWHVLSGAHPSTDLCIHAGVASHTTAGDAEAGQDSAPGEQSIHAMLKAIAAQQEEMRADVTAARLAAEAAKRQSVQVAEQLEDVTARLAALEARPQLAWTHSVASATSAASKIPDAAYKRLLTTHPLYEVEVAHVLELLGVEAAPAAGFEWGAASEPEQAGEYVAHIARALRATAGEDVLNNNVGGGLRVDAEWEGENGTATSGGCPDVLLKGGGKTAAAVEMKKPLQGVTCFHSDGCRRVSPDESPGESIGSPVSSVVCLQLHAACRHMSRPLVHACCFCSASFGTACSHSRLCFSTALTAPPLAEPALFTACFSHSLLFLAACFSRSLPLQRLSFGTACCSRKLLPQVAAAWRRHRRSNLTVAFVCRQHQPETRTCQARRGVRRRP